MIILLCIIFVIHVFFSVVMYSELSEAREVIALHKATLIVTKSPINDRDAQEYELFKSKAELLRLKTAYANEAKLSLNDIEGSSYSQSNTFKQRQQNVKA